MKYLSTNRKFLEVLSNKQSSNEEIKSLQFMLAGIVVHILL
jgi:hypothetical protein